MDDRILTQLLRKTPAERVGPALEALMAMRCDVDDPIALGESELYDALRLPGEYLILKASYQDLERELKEEKIKYKISESLSVVAVFEEDGSALPEIENFVRYIRGVTDPLQHWVFGVKGVERRSETPVTLLFGGILPINQLRMRLGSRLARLIADHADHFLPRFAALRLEVSRKVGIPILPLFPKEDPTLPGNRAELYDPLDGRTICRFDVADPERPEGVERTLAQLARVFEGLGAQMRDKLGGISILV
jgi:hypothetical protein